MVAGGSVGGWNALAVGALNDPRVRGVVNLYGGMRTGTGQAPDEALRKGCFPPGSKAGTTELGRMRNARFEARDVEERTSSAEPREGSNDFLSAWKPADPKVRSVDEEQADIVTAAGNLSHQSGSASQSGEQGTGAVIYSRTCSHTFEMTTEPSPTEAATRLTELARTSPTAKIPGCDVA